MINKQFVIIYLLFLLGIEIEKNHNKFQKDIQSTNISDIYQY